MSKEKVQMDTDYLFKSKPRKRVKGQRRIATKPKKIKSQMERVFQAELKRIRGVDVPELPKEAKIPDPVIIKPKKKKGRVKRLTDAILRKDDGKPGSTN